MYILYVFIITMTRVRPVLPLYGSRVPSQPPHYTVWLYTHLQIRYNSDLEVPSYNVSVNI